MSGLLIQTRDQKLVMPERSSPDKWIALAHRFSELQYLAYKERLDIQPNGQPLKAQLLKFEDSPQAKLMRLSIGTQLLEQFTAMGQDLLKFLRHAGIQLLASRNLSLLDHKSFDTHLVTSLKNSTGQSLSISPQLMLNLAYIFHNAWKKTIQHPAMVNHHSLTSSLYSQNKNEWLRLESTRPEVINYNCLSVFFLCKQLARLSHADFQTLSDIAIPGNPHNLDLSFARGPENFSLSGETYRISPNLSEGNQLANPLNLQATHLRERTCRLIDQGLNRLQLKLQQYEEQELLPKVLTSINGQKDSFLELCHSLENLKKLRDQFIMAVSLSADLLFSKAPEGLVNQDIAQLLKASAPLGVAELIRELETAYFKAAGKLLKNNATTDLSLITDLKAYLAYEAEIKEMIDSATLDLKDPAFRAQGGILVNYYDDAFWPEFFKSSGQMLLYRQNGETVGFFLYYLPGMLPEKFTPEQFRQANGNAYAELAITSPDRPKGTYRQMTQAMIAALQLSDARYLDFVVYDVNTRSHHAQLASGFFPRPARSIALDDFPADNGILNFVPYRLPVSPSALKALQPLQQRLSGLFSENLGRI